METRAQDPAATAATYPYQRVLAAESERTGDAFYHPTRDVVAWFISAVFVAIFVGYVAMIVAWAAWAWWGS